MAADATKTLQIVLEARDNASKTLQTFGSKLNKLSANLTRVGIGLVALGAAPTAALIGATKASIDFESAFAGVRKTVDASEEEFAQLEGNIRNLSKQIPIAATELAGIGEIAGQLGVTGVDNLTKFIKTVGDIAVSTNLTQEVAATAFARIANIMQEPIENVDRMGSSVVDLGNNFATTEQEIVNFATRIAGAGNVVGLTTDQLFAIGTAFSSVGVQAERGGTAVQKVLLRMNEAVNTNNADLKVFADTAGVTIDQFKEADAIERFTLFVEGLGQNSQEATAILEQLDIADQRLIASFLALGNAGDLLRNSVELSSTAWEQNTALVDEAGKRYETSASQIQIFKNNINDLGITIGDIVVPKMLELLSSLRPVITALNSFAVNHPTIVAGFLLLGAAIGLLGSAMIIIGLILPGIVATSTALGILYTSILAPAFTVVAGIITGVLGAAFSFMISLVTTIIAILGGPLTIAIILIVALVAFLAAAWKKNWFDIRGKTQAVVNWFQNTALPRIRSFFASIKAAVNSFVSFWVSAFNRAKSAVQGLIDKISALISKAREAAGKVRGVLGFQHGGVVPGGFGDAVPAILHGGERVIPRTGTDVNPPASGGGGTVINLTIEGDVNSMNTLEAISEAVKDALGRDNELAAGGISI